jgi:hypothetical protein
MTINSIRAYREATLIIAGLIIAAAGLLARITNEPNIEHWFVFAAGLSNLVALFDLGPEIFKGGYSRSARFWLTFELFFFSVILGVDVSLALGQWDTALLIFSIFWVIFALAFMAYSETPQHQIGFLLSALCLVVSLYLMPPFFRLLTPDWKNPIGILILKRGYAWIHLLCIPLVFLLVDWKLSKDHANWINFLFLDRSLVWAGSACAISGLLYALLDPTQGTPTPPLFECGAAALLLLVGNSWYISIEGRTNAQQTT